MSESVYIVCGDTGEYSDYRQWMVEAYLTEDVAKARVMELEQLLLAQGFTKQQERIEQPGEWNYWDDEEKYGKATAAISIATTTGCAGITKPCR